MNLNQDYLKSAFDAAATKTYRTAVRFALSCADREDLQQELMLDLLEHADQFDPAKGSAGTFTGTVSEHCTADFLNDLKKDRSRLSFCSGDEAANDADAPEFCPFFDKNVEPLWFVSRDFPSDSAALHDLERAIAYMNDEQLRLFQLLEVHQEDLPAACRDSGLSTATFYRRVSDLQMHLRMFGFRSAA